MLKYLQVISVDIPKSNQIKIVITFSIVAIIIILLIVFKNQIFYIQNNITDNLKFQREYLNVSEDNVFKYITIEDTISLLKGGTGIVYFGFASCPWCKAYVPILNEVTKENKVGTIYYYDIKDIRAKNTKEYQELVKILSDYLSSDMDENKRIYVPDVYFVKNGKIIGHNNDTSIISGADTSSYYTEEVKENLKLKLTELMRKTEDCNDKNMQGC